MHPPLLSIVIPSHGRAAELRSLARAFLDQREQLADGAASDVELILVDDATEPPLPLGDLEGAQVVRLSSRGGAPGARRAGFEASRGRFIHFHDSDDQVPPFWLSRVLEAIRRPDAPDLLVTARCIVDGSAASATKIPVYAAQTADRPRRLRHYLAFENAIGPLGGVTFSRRAAERLSFPPLPSCQDWHMYWEALGGPCRVQVDPDNHFIFRTNGADRISNSFRRKVLGMAGLARLVAESPRQRRFLRRYFWTVCRGAHHPDPSRLARLSGRVWRAAALSFARNPALAAIFLKTKV